MKTRSGSTTVRASHGVSVETCLTFGSLCGSNLQTELTFGGRFAGEVAREGLEVTSLTRGLDSEATTGDKVAGSGSDAAGSTVVRLVETEGARSLRDGTLNADKIASSGRRTGAHTLIIVECSSGTGCRLGITSTVHVAATRSLEGSGRALVRNESSSGCRLAGGGTSLVAVKTWVTRLALTPSLIVVLSRRA
jgi:hypothetical protein